MEYNKENFKYLAMYVNPEIFRDIELNKKNKLRPEDFEDKIGRKNRKEGLKEVFDHIGFSKDEEDGIAV